MTTRSKVLNGLFSFVLIALGILIGSLYQQRLNTQEGDNDKIPKQYFDFNVLSSEDTTSYVEMGQEPSQDVSDIGYKTVRTR